MLRELFEALGNDPFVIAECLARPVLVERSVGDESSRVRYSADKAEQVMQTSEHRRATQTTRRHVIWQRQVLAMASHNLRIPAGRMHPMTNTWTATSTTNAPLRETCHTAVWTGSEMIVWGGDDEHLSI